MPPQTQQSLLMKTLGSAFEKAFEEVKNREAPIITGGFDLPPGLKGVAKLKECKFIPIGAGKKYAGKPMFFASAVIIEPTEFVDKQGNKWKTKGMLTSIRENCFDTPEVSFESSRKFLKEHLNHIVGVLITLTGQKLSTLTPAQLEPFMAMLTNPGTKEKPNKPIYFAFETWLPSPRKDASGKEVEAQVIHKWMDRIKDYVVPGITDGTQGISDDQTNKGKETPVGVNGTPHNHPVISPTQNRVTPTKPTVKASEPTPTTSADEFNQADEVDGLLQAALAGDESAQQRMGELATNNGYTEEDIVPVTYEELAIMCRTPKVSQNNTSGEGTQGDKETTETQEVPATSESEEAPEEPPQEAPEEESQEPTFPAIGMMCKFAPYDFKAKKWTTTQVTCEIVGYNSEKDTWMLKNMEDGKTPYIGCKADKLIPM